MSFDLLGSAKEALTDGILNQLGDAIGESPGTTRAAVESGLPAILGGLLNRAQSPGGMDAIFDQVKDDDGGILGNIGGALFGENQSTLLKTGGAILSMILGSRMDGVLGTLARTVGISNAGTTGKLLRMLAPVVMGLIGKLRSENNMAPEDMQLMLLNQKETLADHLPAEMRDALGVTELFNAPATDQVDGASTQETGSGSTLKWALIVGALALLAVFFWPRGTEEGVSVPQSRDATTSIKEALPEANVPSIEFTRSLRDLTLLSENVDSIESAQRLADRVSDTTGLLDAMDLSAMSTSARSTLTESVAPIATRLSSAIEKAYQIPGVRPVLEPVVGPLLTKLGAL